MSKRYLTVLLSLFIATGAGWLLWSQASSARKARDTEPYVESEHATPCELEAKRSQRNIASVTAESLENRKQKATFKLQSINGIDSFWYAASITPPLKNVGQQKVFRVRSEPLHLDTVEFEMPADTTAPPELRVGKIFHSYAYLTSTQMEAMDAARPVPGRYPLATRSHVLQVNGDTGTGRTHFTREGNGQAVDLKVAPGTEVLAFGAGTVVFVEDGYDDQLRCGAAHANRYANRVFILQDDGYEAGYGHLMMKSSLVAEGARVERGQPLARVGRYTGSIGGAHLHFQLGGMTDQGLVSVPVAFEDEERSLLIVPREGETIDISRTTPRSRN